MNAKSIRCPFIVTSLALLSLCGCPAQNGGGDGSGMETRFNLPLAAAVGAVEIQGGEMTTFRQTFDLPGLMGPLESVTIDLADTLNSAEVTMLDDDMKRQATAQNSSSTVTYRVGTMEQAETVCETGVLYGPFIVALDANDQPTSIDPPTSALTAASVEVINTGQFSVCVQVMSKRRAMVSVGNLAVDATAESSGDCASPSNFAGDWQAEFICTDSCDPEGFGGEFATTITQEGNQASYSDGQATFSGRVCGNVFTFSANEGAGFVETGTLTLNTDGSATRQSHYRNNDTPNCEGDCQDTFTRTDGGGGNDDHICGNGVIESGEACDDGNTIPGDGCNACQLETGDCVPFGGQCTDDADCCDDFPCIDGICI